MSAGRPNSEHASGISSNEPPATPEAPAALIAVKNTSKIAEGISTFTPIVLQAANDMTAMVTAAPAMFMVAPSGIEIGYVFTSRPRSSHSSKLTGILAAELRVKNAVIPLLLRHLNTSG